MKKYLRRVVILVLSSLSMFLLFYSGPSGCGGGTPLSFALSVNLSGVGSGQVTSNVGSITCTTTGGTCSGTFEEGTDVVLSAVADTGFIFAGWTGGGCQGAGDCTINVKKADSVTAVFIMITFSSSRVLEATDAGFAATSNIWVMKTDGSDLHPITTATASNVISFNPHWSPDGNKIVFESTRLTNGLDAPNTNATRNIWVVNGDGTGLQALTTATAANVDSARPQWSPDGTKIVYESSGKTDGTNAANDNGTGNLWVMNADGSHQHPLTTATADNADAFEPRWSPNGNQIAFYSSRNIDNSDSANANNTSNIWVINADGTGLKAVTTITAANAGSFGSEWSPDGAKLIFVSRRLTDGSDAVNTNFTSNIWVVNADGTSPVALTAITAANANSFDPQFTPDGTRIVFDSSRKTDGTDAVNDHATTTNIWVMNADGTAQEALTTATANLAESFGPRWSPDGTEILFASRRKTDGSDNANDNGTLNIWKVQSSGSGLEALTAASAPNAGSTAPQWSL